MRKIFLCINPKFTDACETDHHQMFWFKSMISSVGVGAIDSSDIRSRDRAEAADLIARKSGNKPVPPVAFALLATSLDFLAITLSVWFSLYAQAQDHFDGAAHMIAATALAISSLTLLHFFSAYALTNLRQIFRGAGLTCVVVCSVAAAGILAGLWDLTGLRLSHIIVALGASLLLSRTASGTVAIWAKEFGLTAQKTVIVGGGKHAARVIRNVGTEQGNDIDLIGLFDDRNDERSPESHLGLPKLGRIADLVAFARKTHIDLVVIALPEQAKTRVRDITEMLRVLPVEIQLWGLSDSFATKPEGAENDRDQPVIPLLRSPTSRNAEFVKRLFDTVVAVIALLILSPLLLGVALAIKLTSPGPVIFVQDRHGYNNQVIKLFKFRSMFVDATDATARRVVARNDPRVTPVGRFIRRTSLDELPQLVNVLLGDISLVGPRPHVVNAVYSETTPFEDLVKNYAARHRVPPGITGWAQINGWRGEIDAPDRLRSRVEHDLYYIENRSFWLDLRILARTIPSLFNTKFAY